MHDGIRVEPRLLNQDKVWALADELEVGYITALGAMLALWSWCYEQRKDGNLSLVPGNLQKMLTRGCHIEEFSGEDFLAAMINTGWVDEVDGELHIHDWPQYAGHGVRSKCKRSLSKQVADAGFGARAKERDGMCCRFCGKAVRAVKTGADALRWHLVDPAKGCTYDNAVVACSACDLLKDGMTLEESGMTLLPEPQTTAFLSPVQTSVQSGDKSGTKAGQKPDNGSDKKKAVVSDPSPPSKDEISISTESITTLLDSNNNRDGSNTDSLLARDVVTPDLKTRDDLERRESVTSSSNGLTHSKLTTDTTSDVSPEIAYVLAELGLEVTSKRRDYIQRSIDKYPQIDPEETVDTYLLWQEDEQAAALAGKKVNGWRPRQPIIHTSTDRMQGWGNQMRMNAKRGRCKRGPEALKLVEQQKQEDDRWAMDLEVLPPSGTRSGTAH